MKVSVFVLVFLYGTDVEEMFLHAVGIRAVLFFVPLLRESKGEQLLLRESDNELEDESSDEDESEEESSDDSVELESSDESSEDEICVCFWSGSTNVMDGTEGLTDRSGL